MQVRMVWAAGLLAAGCQAGEPCSVADQGDGTYLLSCPDGSEVTLTDGEDGLDGVDGADGQDGQDAEVEAPAAVVLQGDVLVQDALDAHALRDVEEITGDLRVDAPGLQRLELPLLTRVGGDLVVENGCPEELVLPAVEEIGGGLWIGSCDDLQVLEGFDSLVTVGEWLQLTDNPQLQVIPEFSSLVSVPLLEIWQHDMLQEITGFQSLTEADVRLFTNDQLQSITGFDALLSGEVALANSASLTHIQGFSSLQSGTVYIWSLPSLQVLQGFNAMTEAHDVELDLLPPAQIDAFDNLAVIHNSFAWVRMHQQPSISLFGALEAVHGAITIVENDALEDLDVLTQLTGLPEWMEISFNTALCQPEIDAVLDHFESQGWTGTGAVSMDGVACD